MRYRQLLVCGIGGSADRKCMENILSYTVGMGFKCLVLVYLNKLSFLSLFFRLREHMKESMAARGVKLSFMPMFIKATSMALLHFPILNSMIDPECTQITYKVGEEFS